MPDRARYPVKHGLIDAPFESRYSSFQRFVDKAIYSKGWGAGATVEFDHNLGYE